MIVPVASVALALAVVTDKSAAVSNVAATLVVVILAPVVMIRWIPAAAASVALVIAAARVTPAVEEPAEFAVTVRIATILPRNSAAEMGMALCAILMRSAVMACVVRRANIAVTVGALIHAGLRHGKTAKLMDAPVLPAFAQVIM